MPKFSRRTKGYNGPVFVAPPIDITTDATIALFVLNAPLGEIGVYDGNNALHTNAITASEKFYFVQRTSAGGTNTNKGVKKSVEFTLGEVTIRKKSYVAPVKQVSSVGWSGTGGNLNPPTSIIAGQTYSLGVIETTEGYEPFPSWNYEYTTKVGDILIDVMLKLAAQINNYSSLTYSQNYPLVSAKVKADATYGNYAFTGTTPVLTVTNGSAIVQIESGANDGAADVAVGDYISFDAAAAPTDAIGDIYKVIAKDAGNDATFTLDRPYAGATQTFTEAEAEGTRVKKVTTFVSGAAGIELTALNYDEHFRIAVRDNLEDASINYTTSFVKGNGTYDEVLAMESEGKLWEGDTARNTVFASAYGTQDTFAVAGETYDCYTFSALKRGKAIAPEGETVQEQTVTIWVARSAGNVDTSLDTYFGL